MEHLPFYLYAICQHKYANIQINTAIVTHNKSTPLLLFSLNAMIREKKYMSETLKIQFSFDFTPFLNELPKHELEVKPIFI